MKLSQLNPNPQNPRTITDEKIKMLKASIEEFGNLDGFIFNAKSKRLAGGHQRLKVLPTEAEIIIEKKYQPPTKSGTIAEGYVEWLGERHRYREVFWDDAKEKAANIAANKGAGMWDLPKLTEWMLELDHLNYDLDLTMWDAKEREDLIVVKEEVGPVEGEDDVPEPRVEPNVKTGQIYQLGNHRLMCGDCTVKENVARLMNGEKADMVFTDPPYGISIVSENGKVGADEFRISTKKYSKIEGDQSTEVWKKAWNNLREIPTIVWGGQFFSDFMPQSGHWLVWNKMAFDKVNHKMSQCELAWTSFIDRNSARQYMHIWDGLFKQGTKADEGQNRVHPTQKPVGLFSAILNDYTQKDELILDPFLGSGSTIISCEKTNRKCYGMEIDPTYCGIILDRWSKFTGKTAFLLDDAGNPSKEWGCLKNDAQH